jgi:CHAD domain-containing protein
VKKNSAGPFSDAIIRSLDDRWTRFRKKLRALRKDVTVDAVHDERTATRRLLSTLTVVEPVIGRKPVRRLEKDLRRVLRSLGPLRDLHVELDATRRFERGPRVPEFRTHLHRQERALKKGAARRAAKVRVGRLRKAIRTVEKRLSRLDRLPQRRFLLERIDEAFQDAVGRRRALDPTDPMSLHRFRVAVKMFRYTVEALQPVLGGFEPRALEQLRQLQDDLGALHDADVLSASFRDFMNDGNRLPHLMPIQKQLLERHHESARKAILEADRILEYWQRWVGKGYARLRSPK